MILRCTGCGREFPFGTYACPEADGVLRAEYALHSIESMEEILDSSRPGVWRYAPVLPPIKNIVSFEEGGTPLIESRRYGNELGVELFFKDEGRNPTGSFKDRSASLMLSTEKELGHGAVATATSGNAGSALALYSRLAGIEANIFMYSPSRAKYLFTRSMGPNIFLVETEKESAVHELTAEACRAFGWSWLTTMAEANPYNLEGYKTIAYEIAEVMGAPDALVIPVGSGTLLLGMWKGFQELSTMGLVGHLPRLIAVQADRVNPLFRAFSENLDRVEPVRGGHSVAGGLVLDDPGITGTTALLAVRESGGAVVSLPENEIIALTHALPLREGIFAEPSGAVTVGGIEKALAAGHIAKGERVVCVISASGFKDMSVFEAASDGRKTVRTPPDIEALRTRLRG
jgi:threonine synthase